MAASPETPFALLLLVDSEHPLPDSDPDARLRPGRHRRPHYLWCCFQQNSKARGGVPGSPRWPNVGAPTRSARGLVGGLCGPASDPSKGSSPRL
jgi:hypothetical protein